MVFFEKIFVADSNQIAVCYCIGSVEFRYSKSSGHRTHFLLWEPKIWIFWFLRFSLLYRRGEYMVFFEKIFVADSNQIAVCYCIGSVEFRYSKSSGH
jgi:hypothetical protein